MRRLVALLVAASYIAVAAAPATRHVHAVGDHAHEDHRHGPAAHAHEHGHHDHAPETASPSIERCDPGSHAVAVAFTCLTPHAEHAPTPEQADAWLPSPPALAQPRTRAGDDRAHSPPRLTDAPLRAPPLAIPA